MTIRSWIRSVFTRPVRTAPSRARLAVLGMEDRWVPSTFTVVNTLDDGSVGSLRWAVGQANANAGDDTVDFDATAFATAQTITLGGTQLALGDLTGVTAIAGPAAGVTVSGGGLSRVFQVDAGASASFARLTIAGGNVTDAGDGGGLLNNGTAALAGCTVSGNSATNGGGIANAGTMAVVNCTLSGNAAAGATGGDGGGIANGGQLSVTNSTISGNTSKFFFNYYYPYNYGGGAGGGLNNAAGGTSTLTNTIVSGNLVAINNTPYRFPSDIGGTVTGSFNLVGFGGAGGLENGVDGNVITGAPLLGKFGNYGGATDTIPLLPGSPAIDAGTAAGAPATDQRGLGRVGGVDIGAFESQGFTLTPAAGTTPQSAAIGAAFANPLAVAVTANNAVEPVDGGLVSFAAVPAANGASALGLPGSAVAISGGQTAGFSAGPNNVLGAHQVTAATAGATPAAFALTNTGTAFTKLVVNTTGGGLFAGAGLLSLPLAVQFSNAVVSGSAAITFDAKVFKTAQTITLTGAQLQLSNTTFPQSVTGPNKGVTVSGGGLSRVFQVDAGVSASISGLTITGGQTDGNGGGVAVYGTAVLTNCTISGNTAGSAGGYSFSGGSGGGVYNAGTATLTNCTISGNTANASFFGGGGGIATGSFFAGGAAVTTLTNCVITQNTTGGYAAGGGVYNAGTTTLNNCTISSNSSFAGGGVLSGASLSVPAGVTSTVTLNNCTVSGNSAVLGGGVLTGASGIGGGGYALIFQAATVLNNCTVSGNTADEVGGGVWTTGGNTTATDTRIINNTANDGGGVLTQGFFFYGPNFGSTTLTNCTISGNSADRDGGGLATGALGITTAVNSKITGNTAGRDGGGASALGQTSSYAGDQLASTTLTGCSVSGNSAAGAGGGLNNGTLASTTVNGSSVNNNSADAGGGIANAGTLVVGSSSVNNNRATSKGGGLSTTAGSATITNSAVNANQVNSTGTAQGGGINSEDSDLSLTNCSVNANRANGTTARGGGIYAALSTVTLHGCSVNGNRATGSVLGEGGGIYSSGSVLSLSATNVRGNKASTAGDDIMIVP